MKLNRKKNEVNLNGYISQVEARTGQHGAFGSATIAVDDSYRAKPTQPGQSGNFVERTQFIRVELGDDIATLQKGDFVSFSGKLTYEPADNGQSYLKVKGRITDHLPKAALDVLKQAGFWGKQGSNSAPQNQLPQSGRSAPQRHSNHQGQQPQGNYGQPQYGQPNYQNQQWNGDH